MILDITYEENNRARIGVLAMRTKRLFGLNLDDVESFSEYYSLKSRHPSSPSRVYTIIRLKPHYVVRGEESWMGEPREMVIQVYFDAFKETYDSVYTKAVIHEMSLAPGSLEAFYLNKYRSKL